MTDHEPTEPEEPVIGELRLALENRVAALAELHDRVCRLEAERAPLEDELDEARRVRHAATVACERLEHEVADLGHRARVAEHELGVLRHETERRIWELEHEAHELRVQLAATTERAVAAEQRPLHHLLARARTKARRVLRSG